MTEVNRLQRKVAVIAGGTSLHFVAFRPVDRKELYQIVLLNITLCRKEI